MEFEDRWKTFIGKYVAQISVDNLNADGSGPLSVVLEFPGGVLRIITEDVSIYDGYNATRWVSARLVAAREEWQPIALPLPPQPILRKDPTPEVEHLQNERAISFED